jgi:hypothetical protein
MIGILDPFKALARPRKIQISEKLQKATVRHQDGSDAEL